MLLRKSSVFLVIAGMILVATAFKILEPAPADPPADAKIDKNKAFVEAADTYFQSVLDELGAVPGLSIAVVKDDEPVYVKGFGYANLEKKQKVDANTIFYIASCTKSFTSLLAMCLDEKGIIKLDDPITKYLPEVTFDPKLQADQVTIRDLLRHTSGMENGPVTYRVAYSGEHDLKTLIQLLDYTEANKAGRGHFQYTNFGYNLYSIIVDKVTGKHWQDWLADEIFKPLDMRHTTAYMSKVDKNGWDLALPYMNLINEPAQPVYLIKTDQSMQAAGGLITNANDAATWLEVQMNEGKLNGKQVFPKEMIAYTHQKLIDTKAGERAEGEIGRDYYGMGWMIGDFKGHTIIQHGGGYPGYRTFISFDPEAKIGVAVAANEGLWGDNVGILFMEFAYDWWYGETDMEQKYEQKKKDLIEHATNLSKRFAAHDKERAGRTWQLSELFTAYTGTYVSELYGTVKVKGHKDKLEVAMGNLHCIAEPYTDKNTIRVELVPGSGEVITFKYENDKLIGAENGGVFFKKVK